MTMAANDALVADLYNLWEAGKIGLPRVTALYAQASRDMHNTGWQEDKAFERTKREWLMLTVDEMGPVYPYWKALRDELQSVFGLTAQNLGDTATALLMIVDRYNTADTQAALRIKQKDRLAYTDLPQPPATIPQIEMPGDPYQTQTTTTHIEVLGVDIPVTDEEPVR